MRADCYPVAQGMMRRVLVQGEARDDVPLR
jgi:hypothetical protein